MPPTKLLREVSSREYVCRSCLASLGKPNAFIPPPRWTPVRRYSQNLATKTPEAKPLVSDKELERRNILEKLGLLKTEKKGDKNGFSVNYFEEQDDGKLRKLSDQTEFSSAVRGEDMDEQLRRFEKQVAQLQLDTIATQKEFAGAKEVRELRQRYSLMIPRDGFPLKDRRAIDNLNKHIRKAAQRLDEEFVDRKILQDLWRSYSTARRALSSSWSLVPQATWDVLWDAFSSEHDLNPNRMAHIVSLAKDMAQAGIELHDAQQMLAIEAMFTEGWKKEAIENHRRLVTTLGADSKVFVEFWQLGLRMYCLSGDLERAERIVERLSGSPPATDPRFVLPYIKACAENPATVEKGYERFRDLRAALGTEMTVEDYDQIIAFFLGSNQTEYALSIFAEMMTGAAVDVRGMKVLPSSINNEFFVGKWLKRLIGAEDLDSAYNVIMHMKQRGVIPRAIQVNGLIGAWFRTKTAENVRKAEYVAREMIDTRIRFVQMRNQGALFLPEKVRLLPTGDGWPRATIETFNVLAISYKERNVINRLGALWEDLRKAEIAPDTTFLTELLAWKLDSGDGVDIRALWHELSTTYRVNADPYTYTIFWKTLQVNRQYNAAVPANIFAEVSKARQLFAEMVDRKQIFLRDAGVDIALARLILLSFRKLDDNVGLLVAFRALRQVLGLRNPETLLFEIVGGVTDVEKAARVRSTREKIFVISKRVDNFLEQRKGVLIASGKLSQGAEMTDEQKSEELGNYIELHLQAAIERLEDVELRFRVAAKEMGVIGGQPVAEGRSGSLIQDIAPHES